MTDAWSPRLSEYLDGELSAAEHEACTRHLASCAACRNELERLKRIVARLDGLADAGPARDLWPELAARLAEDRRPSPIGRHPWVRWAALAAAVLVVAVVLPRWLQPTPSGPSESAEVGALASYEASAAAWRGRIAATELPAELDEERRALLASHDRAIREVRAALRDAPGDAELEAYLARALRMQARAMARFESVVESVQ